MIPTDDPVRRFFAELDDPTRFVVCRGVPVAKPFDVVRVDRDGNPIQLKASADDLPKWADATNALESEGVLPVIFAGHRITPNEGEHVPETDQPLVVGYQRNFRVGELRGQPALVCDDYYRIDRVDLAREFPFRSIEFYPGRPEIRATALLKRDPQLNLGLIAFANEGATMADDTSTVNMDADALTPDEEKTAGKFWAHFEKSNPYLGFARQCFEGQSSMGTNQGADTTTVTPPDPEAVRMAADQQSIKFAQVESRVAALEVENKTLKLAAETARCEQMITQLEAENFELDRAYEVGQLVNLGPNDRQTRIEYIRKHHTRKPLGGSMVPTDGVGPPARQGSLTRDESDAAAKHAYKHGCTFNEAVAAIRKV